MKTLKKVQLKSKFSDGMYISKVLNDEEVKPTESDPVPINDDEEVIRLSLEDKLERLVRIGYYGQSALGDDYAAVTLRPKGVPDSQFEKLYFQIEGWEVAWAKSLTTPFSIEFLREQAIPGYKMELRLTSEENYDKVVYYVLVMKPTAHVLKTFVFPESIDSYGKAISTLSQIMRWRNIEMHPNLYDLIMKLKDLFHFQLLTNDSWYVPLYNLDAWVKAGKPSDGSPYHVKISNITSLIKISTLEAEYLNGNIINMLDIAWTKLNSDFDPIGELPRCRLVRMLEAIRTNNRKEIEKITSEVKKIEDNTFIVNYNTTGETLVEEEVEEIITELAKLKFVANAIESD